MELRYRLAAALLAAALAAGCGGARPESGTREASTPAVQPAPAPAPAPATPPPSGQPASSTPAPAVTPPAQPQKPVTSVPANPNPGTAPVTADPAPPGQPMAVTTLQKGAHSGVTERKAVLITDEAAWTTNWQQTNAMMMPVPPAPAMDFSNQSVLAVYMGEKRTGGYAIEITGVELVNGTLKVAVRQITPSPGAMVTMALTQPYHMVRIPKVPAGTKVEVNW